MPPNGDITAALSRFREPDAQAALIAAVYDELRLMAARYMTRERAGHTLQPTALVHEAWLRLVKIQSVDWNSRSQFFAIAATIMRHILVDHARQYLSGDPGGKVTLIALEEFGLAANDEDSARLVEVDLALDRLASVDEQAAKVIELRFFGGLSVAETAGVLAISVRAVERDWTFGRAWLKDRLTTKIAHASAHL